MSSWGPGEHVSGIARPRGRRAEHRGRGYARADARSCRPPRALLVGIAGGLAARRARLLTRLVRLGRPVERSGDVPRRVAREGIEVLGQRKLFQRALPGLMHALIFWGFLVLLTTIVEVMGELIDPTFELPADRRHRLAGPGPGRVRGRRAGRDRDRGRHPAVRAPRALRREPSVGGLPDPRPHLPDHRHAVPRARRTDRRGVRAGLVVDARVDGRVVPVRLDVGGVAAGLDVDLPVGPRRDHPRVPRLPRVLEAPAHRHERDQRLLREHPTAGHPDPAPDRSRERRDARTCTSARPRSPISRGSRPWTCTRAPSAGAARARARRGTRASRSRPSSWS